MYREFFKRVFDLGISLLVLPLFLLICLILGPIIYISDKGPIFYNALRLGKNGNVFKMYKFRSMKVNAPDIRNEDGSTFNSNDDPRVTKIGKFLRKSSIDEIPQILNVLKGDMSIIGPRPDLPEHIIEYNDNEKIKLKVKPGLTGYNQAYFRNSISWKKRIENDIYYVQNLSLLFDLKILFKTIISVLSEEHIFVVPSNQKVEESDD